MSTNLRSLEEKKKWLKYLKGLRAYTKAVEGWVESIHWDGDVAALDEGSNPPPPPPPPPHNN